MRLLRLSDVPTTDRDRVFRASPVNGVVTMVLVAAGAGFLFWFGSREQAWIFHVLGGFLVLALLFLRRFVFSRFRPSNWLVRSGDAGVYVHFRS
jgi:hypothetical protein